MSRGSRRDVSGHWPTDFIERRRLAARYGFAATENALAFFEQADTLLATDVVEPFDDTEMREEELEDEDDLDFLMDDLDDDDALEASQVRDLTRPELRHGAHAKARAFALTVYGVEEVAKAYAATLVLAAWTDPDEPALWQAFWDFIEGHHIKKIEAALTLERVLPVVAGVKKRDEISLLLREAVSKDLSGQRDRALYVDVSRGIVETPEMVAADSASQELRTELARNLGLSSIVLQMGFEKRLKELESP